MADDRVARNLRLPVATAEDVEIVARTDAMSGNELITIAVQQYISRRRKSAVFRRRLAQRHADELGQSTKEGK